MNGERRARDFAVTVILALTIMAIFLVVISGCAPEGLSTPTGDSTTTTQTLESTIVQRPTEFIYPDASIVCFVQLQVGTMVCQSYK